MYSEYLLIDVSTIITTDETHVLVDASVINGNEVRRIDRVEKALPKNWKIQLEENIYSSKEYGEKLFELFFRDLERLQHFLQNLLISDSAYRVILQPDLSFRKCRWERIRICSQNSPVNTNPRQKAESVNLLTAPNILFSIFYPKFMNSAVSRAERNSLRALLVVFDNAGDDRKEKRLVENIRQEIGKAGGVEFEYLHIGGKHPPSLENIKKTFSEKDFDILHIFAHGALSNLHADDNDEPNFVLTLSDKNGKAVFPTHDDIWKLLFSLGNKKPGLVYLSVCYSNNVFTTGDKTGEKYRNEEKSRSFASDLIERGGVDVVVSATGRLLQDHAIRGSGVFYSEIGRTGLLDESLAKATRTVSNFHGQPPVSVPTVTRSTFAEPLFPIVRNRFIDSSERLLFGFCLVNLMICAVIMVFLMRHTINQPLAIAILGIGGPLVFGLWRLFRTHGYHFSARPTLHWFLSLHTYKRWRILGLVAALLFLITTTLSWGVISCLYNSQNYKKLITQSTTGSLVFGDNFISGRYIDTTTIENSVTPLSVGKTLGEAFALFPHRPEIYAAYHVNRRLESTLFGPNSHRLADSFIRTLMRISGFTTSKSPEDFDANDLVKLSKDIFKNCGSSILPFLDPPNKWFCCDCYETGTSGHVLLNEVIKDSTIYAEYKRRDRMFWSSETYKDYVGSINNAPIFDAITLFSISKLEYVKCKEMSKSRGDFSSPDCNAKTIEEWKEHLTSLLYGTSSKEERTSLFTLPSQNTTNYSGYRITENQNSLLFPVWLAWAFEFEMKCQRHTTDFDEGNHCDQSMLREIIVDKDSCTNGFNEQAERLIASIFRLYADSISKLSARSPLVDLLDHHNPLFYYLVGFVGELDKYTHLEPVSAPSWYSGFPRFSKSIKYYNRSISRCPAILDVLRNLDRIHALDDWVAKTQQRRKITLDSRSNLLKKMNLDQDWAQLVDLHRKIEIFSE